jgi:hypothetical protein
VEYVTGERTEKAAAAQAEVDALKAARVKAGRRARRAAAKAGGGGGGGSGGARLVADSELAAATMGW